LGHHGEVGLWALPGNRFGPVCADDNRLDASDRIVRKNPGIFLDGQQESGHCEEGVRIFDDVTDTLNDVFRCGSSTVAFSTFSQTIKVLVGTKPLFNSRAEVSSACRQNGDGRRAGVRREGIEFDEEDRKCHKIQTAGELLRSKQNLDDSSVQAATPTAYYPPLQPLTR